MCFTGTIIRNKALQGKEEKSGNLNYVKIPGHQLEFYSRVLIS